VTKTDRRSSGIVAIGDIDEDEIVFAEAATGLARDALGAAALAGSNGACC